MEVTGSLVVQVIVADWPTVRGLSRPVIVRPNCSGREYVLCNIYINMYCSGKIIVLHATWWSQLLIERDPS